MAYITWAGRQYVMPKIIVVVGPANSGKTTSIRNFLENRNIQYLKNGDVTVVIPIRKRKKILAVGIASGGDNQTVLTKNFNFLIPRNCDIIICAARTSGPSINYIVNRFGPFGSNVIRIDQTRISNFTPARETARNAVTARKIKSNI